MAAFKKSLKQNALPLRIFSFFLFLALLPVIALCAFIVFLEDRLFPFHFSERLGKDGEVFFLFKMRTMAPKREKDAMFSGNQQNRVTRSGRFLRRFKIDELPQIWNLVRGDIRFIGPRADVKKSLDYMKGFRGVLMQEKPGLFDLASIVFCNEDRMLALKKPEEYKKIFRLKTCLSVFCIQNTSFYKNPTLFFLLFLRLFPDGFFLRCAQFFGKKFSLSKHLMLASYCYAFSGLKSSEKTGG